MYPNILSNGQKELLPILGSLQREFYLVGGTAIALQIGHRQSIDYSEEATFLPSFEVSNDEVKRFLTEVASRSI